MITVLAGGTGSVKLVRGLAQVSDEEIVIIVNVGDNIWMHGLYICPDIDTILYGLAGLLDEERGWGIKGDSFHFLEQLRSWGEEAWFRLGDRDLAVHIFRTKLIREGLSLSQITDILRHKLGIKQRILPVSDDHAETHIITEAGDLHLQEFWVKRGGSDRVLRVDYRNAERARPAPHVLDSIAKARRVILCPANPITSIGPILAIPGIREELKKAQDVVAVSPIIGHAPISGPAGKLMSGLGIEVSCVGVAKLYSGFLKVMMIDTQDSGFKDRIEKMKVRVMLDDIRMRSKEDEKRLARALLR